MNRTKVTPKTGRSKPIAKKANTQASETVEISTKRGKQKVIPLKAPAGKQSFVITAKQYEEMTNTIRWLNDENKFFDEETTAQIEKIKSLTAAIDKQSKDQPGQKTFTLCHTCEFKNNCPFNRNPTEAQQIICLSMNEIKNKLERLKSNSITESISIEGKQYQVFPAIHFVKLINANN